MMKADMVVVLVGRAALARLHDAQGALGNGNAILIGIRY
jgi:hypothetical protein